MKVHAFPAKSTNKVAEDLQYCLSDRIRSDGYMGVFNPSVFLKDSYKWIYYVVEWVLTDEEIDFINNLPKPVIPASNWVKFLSRNYKYPAVHHEVNRGFLKSKPVFKFKGQFDFFAISYSLIRKTPKYLIRWANRTKHKGIILADMLVCSQIKNPNVRCLDSFGTHDEGVLKAIYMQSKAYIFLSGDEGFGLPPLEATYVGKPVIAYPTMPYLEWHDKDIFTVPVKYLKYTGLYQDGTLHPVVVPKPEYEEELYNFVEDMIGHQPEEDENTLTSIDRVRTEYVYCNQYNKIKDLLIKNGII